MREGIEVKPRAGNWTVSLNGRLLVEFGRFGGQRRARELAKNLDTVLWLEAIDKQVNHRSDGPVMPASITDEFLRSVVQDNQRLRADVERLTAQLEQCQSDAAAAAKAAADLLSSERMELEHHIWRLVGAAGGEVTIPYDAKYDGPKRLLIENNAEHWVGIEYRWRYRFVPNGEVVSQEWGRVVPNTLQFSERNGLGAPTNP